jgi:RecA/RadA recombinase
MAKRAKVDVEEVLTASVPTKDISAMLKLLRKTTNSVSAEESPYNKVSHYVDTGSYAMNYLISGDFFKGIPAGKVVLISGETGTLKTIQALRLAANALNHNNYDMIFYIDTEGGAPYDTLKHMGCDPAKVEHVLAENVEDATVKIMAVYNNIKKIKEQYPEFRALLICDSIGGLNAQKFQNDVDAGVQKVDQGNRARLINALVRGCTIPALTTDCTIIFINHIYEGPTGPFAVSKIKDQGGGKGLQYLASISIQCTKLLQKNAAIKMRGEDADRSVESFYSGSVFKFFSVKNRLIRPFLEVPVYVDFASGFGGMKYLGIVGLAKKYGYVADGKPGCYEILIGSHKGEQIKRGVLISSESDEIWKTFINELNEKASADANYGADQPKDEDLEIAVENVDDMEKNSLQLADVD